MNLQELEKTIISLELDVSLKKADAIISVTTLLKEDIDLVKLKLDKIG